jgi:hypothetical protein
MHYIVTNCLHRRLQSSYEVGGVVRCPVILAKSFRRQPLWQQVNPLWGQHTAMFATKATTLATDPFVQGLTV